MPSLLISLLIAIWIAGIGILSVQNATLVSLQFLTLRSIQLPIGMVLAFSAVVGLVGMATIQAVWNLTSQPRVRNEPGQRR